MRWWKQFCEWITGRRGSVAAAAVAASMAVTPASTTPASPPQTVEAPAQEAVPSLQTVSQTEAAPAKAATVARAGFVWRGAGVTYITAEPVTFVLNSPTVLRRSGYIWRSRAPPFA